MWLKLTSIAAAALILTNCASSTDGVCFTSDQHDALGFDHDHNESNLIRVVQHQDDEGVWAYSIVVPKSIGEWRFTGTELSFRSSGAALPDMYLSLEMRSNDQDLHGVTGLKDDELHGFLAINDQKFDTVYFRASYGCVVIGKTVFPHNNSLNPDALKRAG